MKLTFVDKKLLRFLAQLSLLFQYIDQFVDHFVDDFVDTLKRTL